MERMMERLMPTERRGLEEKNGNTSLKLNDRASYKKSYIYITGLFKEIVNDMIIKLTERSNQISKNFFIQKPSLIITFNY